MLNLSVRPQPAAVAAMSALPATAGENRSPLAANHSGGIGPTSTAGFFGSSAMRRWPRAPGEVFRCVASGGQMGIHAAEALERHAQSIHCR